MTPLQYLSERLRNGMIEGEMHHCLRDTGRLAGGLLASGALATSDVDTLEATAADRAIHDQEARRKWREAVEHGRREPVAWNAIARTQDRVLDWNDTIGDDYRVVDLDWLEPVDVEEPDDWDPVAQISTYLSTLFAGEEHVGYVVEAWRKEDKCLPSRGNCDRTAGQLLDELNRYRDLGAVFGDIHPEVGAWIRFNPLDGQGVKDANVTDYRFALVESDDMPIDQQRAVYERLELPAAVLVHSGGKSLHAIVRIEADSLPEYKRRVNLLYEVCGKNGLSVDRQNCNPSRLSRMPGVHRNGRKQYIVATNVGKPSWSAWEEWIEAVNDDLPEMERVPKDRSELPPVAPALIDGVLRQGHKMLLAGPSKAGKSFFLLELCAAIAEGRDWLGMRCTQGCVLYVNLELDRPSALHRLHDVYEVMGWPKSNIHNITMWNLRGEAIPMDKLAPKLIRRAHKDGFLAVVIDPIYKVITGDENAADKMAHFCNQFDRVCHQLKAAVIYCHHHSKGSQGGKRSMDRASGSGVFARDPDALLDLIELEVSDHLRRQQENTAICELLSGILDQRVFGWRDDVGPDDLLSESKMRSLAARMLGDSYNAVLPAIVDARKAVHLRTAWRVEGTFREFPRAAPVNCWFDHPRHFLDTEGVLQDADPEGMEPPWARGTKGQQQAKGSRRKRRQEDMRKAHQTLAADGPVTVAAMAEYLDIATRTLRDWCKEQDGWNTEGGIVTTTTSAAES